MLEGEFVVRAYSIISTDLVAFEVYEPLAGHSTQFTDEKYGRLGAVLSRPLALEVAALPAASDERIAACRAQWATQEAVCEHAIRAAFPEFKFGPADIGNGHALLYLSEVAV